MRRVATLLLLAGCVQGPPVLDGIGQAAGCPVADPCLRVAWPAGVPPPAGATMMEGVAVLPWPGAGATVELGPVAVRAPDSEPAQIRGCPTPQTAAGAWRLTFFDVGQGDATLIETPTGRAILVDTGPRHAGARLAQDLLGLGRSRLDVLVLTHPDADHVGGTAALLGAVHACTVVHPGLGSPTATWRQTLEAINRSSAAEAVAGTGAALPDGVLVLHAGGEESNNASIVLHVPVPGGALLTADAPCAVEERIGRNWPDLLPAAVLKAGHHGSHTSTCQAFVDVAKPRLGILTVGWNNYGHPHPDVLNRLACAAETYRTDRHGTVVVSFDPLEARPEWRTPRVACPPEKPAAVIAALVCDAPGDDRTNPGGEQVTIVARVSLDLAGWSIEDRHARNRFTFPPGTTAGPGDALVIRSGPGPYADALAWGGPAPVWNNDGDEARLFDTDGALVDHRPCPS